MRILHTSDWHLGRSLYGRRRHQEFEAFLHWLAEVIEQQAIDILLIAGDIFDTSTPGNRAQELYYGFLSRMAASQCRHIVIIAGNHDSPSFLAAPKGLLKSLGVHVHSSLSESLTEEILLLRDRQGAPEAIVCALPYLRDRDMRLSEAGESPDDKQRKLIECIRTQYQPMADHAAQLRAAIGLEIPIIAMGHLFVAGGKTLVGDGVRELYVGSLAQVGADIFSSVFDYVALGHLHIPQQVAGLSHIRYSGSPLPMGFGEAGQQKSLCLLSFENRRSPTEQGDTAAVTDFHAPGSRVPHIELLPIPVFQALERISGDWPHIQSRIQALAEQGANTWLEIIYTGAEILANLSEQLAAEIADTRLEILKVKNNRLVQQVLSQSRADETLDDLGLHQVFERCLAAHTIPDEQGLELRQTYAEILISVQEADIEAKL